MKKIFMLSSAFIILAAGSASARVDVDVNLGAPVVAEPVYPAPVYVEPGYVVAPDWPSAHYDYHRHRHNDYWAGRQHEEREHAERRR